MSHWRALAVKSARTGKAGAPVAPEPSATFDRRFEACFRIVHGTLLSRFSARVAEAHTRAILLRHVDVLARRSPQLTREEAGRLLQAAREVTGVR